MVHKTAALKRNIDLPAMRTRGFPWQIWRTSFAYDGCRHSGLQGSLSWYELTGWGAAPSAPNPWGSENQYAEKCMPPGAGGKPKLLCPYNAGGWGVLLYPPRDGNLTEAPATSIRWELFAKGLADAEYFARLDAMATRALDGCAADAAASRCCREAARSQAVLEAVGKVVWNFSDVPSNIDLTSGGVGKHYHYDEPYSTNTTLMHEVVDGVAAQIEIVAAACGERPE